MRAVSRLSLRAARPAAASAARAATALPSLAPRFACPAFVSPAPAPARRAFTTTPVACRTAGPRVVGYDEVKRLSEQPTDATLLVDVREPDEVALGSIPSAVNLPLSRLKDALDARFNPGEFQKEFAFPKPASGQDIVFFCRSGKRSATACEWAADKGFNKVRNYEGSWLDWSAREKQGEDD
ncbi:hypothetical protein Q5752_001403 [Cryptotrichosporon argae]